MIAIVILGCFMVGLNIMFSYLELLPYIDAVKGDINKLVSTKNHFMLFWRYITLPFKLLSHIHLLLPTVVDLGAMWVLTHTFSLGNSLAGGLTGLFASNLVSILVFCKTHKGHVWSSIFSLLPGKPKPKVHTTHRSYKCNPIKEPRLNTIWRGQDSTIEVI